MVKFFRKLLIFFWLSCFSGLTIAILLYLPLPWIDSFGDTYCTAGLWIFQHPVSSSDSATITCVFAMIVFALLPALLIQRFSIKKYKKILGLLYDECDPKKYLEQLLPLLDRGKENSSIKQVLCSNYAVGLHAAGDLPAAVKITEALLKRPVKEKFLINQVFLNGNLFSYYASSGELDKAKEALQKGKEILMAHKEHRFFERCKLHFYDADHAMLFYEGEYEAALACYKNALPLSKDRYGQVCIHYMLARIHEKLGDVSKQKEHLSFVAQTGNTLEIASKARQLLETLENTK